MELPTAWSESLFLRQVVVTDIAGSAMLAGRSFQGIGSGIILVLVEIVLADLVSLSERYAAPFRLPELSLILC